jgi:hypothetical protein
MGRSQTKVEPLHFTTIPQTDLPQGRNGKHRKLVTIILKDIDALQAGSAIKVRGISRSEGKRSFCLESSDAETRSKGCDRQ